MFELHVIGETPDAGHIPLSLAAFIRAEYFPSTNFVTVVLGEM
jgi:hypothetical protein